MKKYLVINSVLIKKNPFQFGLEQNLLYLCGSIMYKQNSNHYDRTS
ncbi:MAG: hypothetical protein FWD02_06635 [Bacteroidales bacterium]|nr:hypothetical protein [Bacteroidales bacterium]